MVMATAAAAAAAEATMAARKMNDYTSNNCDLWHMINTSNRLPGKRFKQIV